MEREPFLFRDLFLEALRSDGRIADALLDVEGCRRPSAGAHCRVFLGMDICRRGLHRLSPPWHLREVCLWRSLEGFLWGVDGKGLF